MKLSNFVLLVQIFQTILVFKMSFFVTVELLNELFVEYQRSAKYMPGKMPPFGEYVNNYTMAQNNNNLVTGTESSRVTENSAPAFVSSAVKQSDKLVNQALISSDSKRKIVDISDKETVEKIDDIGIIVASPEKLAEIQTEKVQQNADMSSVIKSVVDFISNGDVKVSCPKRPYKTMQCLGRRHLGSGVASRASLKKTPVGRCWFDDSEEI